MLIFPRSKTLAFQLASVDDAEFILSLRNDPKYNLHLSSVGNDVEKQKSWLEAYKAREKKALEYYFIIINKKNEKCGTVRLYDFQGDSFCWGSWILNEKKTRFAALESAYIVYKFAFDELGFQKSHFDVRKENAKVIKFHKRMGAEIKGEDKINFYFEIQKEDVLTWLDDHKEKIL